MKKIKKQLMAVLMILAVMIANLAVPTEVQAATKAIKLSKTLSLKVGDGMADGDQWTYGTPLQNSVKTDKISKVKSSNSKVAVFKISYDKYNKTYGIGYMAKKAGTSTLSFKVKRKNGKTYTFKQKVTVINYTNPFKKFSYAGTDYAKEFNSVSKSIYAKSAKKAKVNISLKSGYKLLGIYYQDDNTGKMKKIKNGASIKMDNHHYLFVKYKNTKKNYTYQVTLCGNGLVNWG